MLKERRGYIVLACLSIFLSVMVLLIVADQRKDNNHKFCQVIALHIKEPVVEPVRFGLDPAVDRQYQLHVERIKLAKELGCIY